MLILLKKNECLQLEKNHPVHIYYIYTYILYIITNDCVYIIQYIRLSVVLNTGNNHLNILRVRYVST